MKVTKYRDTKTGRFVSKGTWRRSKAQGGARYRRQKVQMRVGKRRKVPPIPPRALPPGAISITPGMAIPAEFLLTQDMFFGGEDFGEEAEY